MMLAAPDVIGQSGLALREALSERYFPEVLPTGETVLRLKGGSAHQPTEQSYTGALPGSKAFTGAGGRDWNWDTGRKQPKPSPTSRVGTVLSTNMLSWRVATG
ncbi:MAG: hypothetical protein GY755_10475 [Chloroflexi bacterium]|nr:hypothetical protein [Chloroflexota bacterium]